MKKYFIILMFILLPAISFAEDFLSAPVVPGSQTVEKDDRRLEYTTGLSHNDVLSFYRENLKSLEDIKYRDWADSTYIEDDGKKPWHSITISKINGSEGTTVIIAKDNWTWIIGTLILRYVAVFVVLLVLYAGMKISGQIISSIVKKAEAKKA
ncbi:hypothetical protein ACFL6W_00595 [Thermodesulfobacteriota bacterium]